MAGEPGHVEVKLRAPIGTGSGREFPGSLGTLKTRDDSRPRHAAAVLITYRHVQGCASCRKPAFGVEQLHSDGLDLARLAARGGSIRARRPSGLRAGKLKSARAKLFHHGLMLTVQAQLQEFFAARIQRQQIGVAASPAMRYAPPVIHGGVDDGVPRAAIFGLHVVVLLAHAHVGIVTKQNAHLSSRGAGQCALGTLSRTFDRVPANRYYSPLNMSGSGLHAYAPLLLYLLVATALAAALTTVSVWIGWRRPNRAKQEAYECGMEPTGDARQPFSVKFYLVAMVFILFDVEAIFLYPWAYIYRDMLKASHGFGVYGYVEMLLYIAILLVGYIYLWKKGAFDWNK
jgi:NADH-quinone oxidoreductase subunit A